MQLSQNSVAEIPWSLWVRLYWIVMIHWYVTIIPRAAAWLWSCWLGASCLWQSVRHVPVVVRYHQWQELQCIHAVSLEKSKVFLLTRTCCSGRDKMLFFSDNSLYSGSDPEVGAENYLVSLHWREVRKPIRSRKYDYCEYRKVMWTFQMLTEIACMIIQKNFFMRVKKLSFDEKS